MKKAIFVVVAMLFLLTACSTQTEVNPDLFVSRFMQAYPEFNVNAEQMFYENDKCVVFVDNSAGVRFVAEMTVDEADRVQKISLACAETDRVEELYFLAECVAKLYAPQEDFETIAKELFCEKNYSYYESQWYYYCFSKTETGLFFSIENKYLAPTKTEGLTLKENETILTR